MTGGTAPGGVNDASGFVAWLDGFGGDPATLAEAVELGGTSAIGDAGFVEVWGSGLSSGTVCTGADADGAGGTVAGGGE